MCVRDHVVRCLASRSVVRCLLEGRDCVWCGECLPSLKALCCVVRCSYSLSFIFFSVAFSVNEFGQLFWWSTPRPLNPLSVEANRVKAEDAEYQRKETKHVEWVEHELAETLCEMSPSLELANQRRINVAGVVRSKSHVNETGGF